MVAGGECARRDTFTRQGGAYATLDRETSVVVEPKRRGHGADGGGVRAPRGPGPTAKTQYPRYYGRRHRLVQPERLSPGDHGVSNASYRPSSTVAAISPNSTASDNPSHEVSGRAPRHH